MSERKFEGIRSLSPNRLATLMLIFSILMTLFDPQVYKNLLYEPDIMFLNWNMYLYMCLMLAFFTLGGQLFKIFSKKRDTSYSETRTSSPFNLLVATSFFVWLFMLLNVVVIINTISAIGLNEFVQNTLHPSNDARIALSQSKAGNGLSWLGAASTGMLSLFLWLVIGKISNKTQPLTRRIYAWTLLVFFFAINLVAALSTQARGPVLSLLLQVAFGIIAGYTVKQKLDARKLLAFGIVILIVSAGFFGLVQQSRIIAGGSSIPYSEAILKAFLGYFPASYNRLAYILAHKLTLPGAGSGFIALQGIYTFPGLSNLFKVSDIARGLNLPVPQDEFTAWIDAFKYIRYGGLNEAFIWPTVWGSALLDFGWLAPLWWVAYGMLGAWAFREFQKFSFYGLLIYPWFVVTILQWYGDAVIGNRNLPILFIVAALIKIIIKIINSSKQRQVVR